MSKYICLILTAILLILISAKPRQQDYIVIERDYEGDILLDLKSGVRYLRTGEGMYVIGEQLQKSSRNNPAAGEKKRYM